MSSIIQEVSILGHGKVYRFASLKIRMARARKVGETAALLPQAQIDLLIWRLQVR